MVIFQILDYEPNQIMYVTLTICIPFVDFADSADKTIGCQRFERYFSVGRKSKCPIWKSGKGIVRTEHPAASIRKTGSVRSAPNGCRAGHGR